MTGNIADSIPSPRELRYLYGEYYPFRKNGFDLFDTPDMCLEWLSGELHQPPVPAQVS